MRIAAIYGEANSMTAESPSRFRRVPKPTDAGDTVTKRRWSEKLPRDWTVRKPDAEIIQMFFEKCRPLVDVMHGKGEFTLSVYDLRPPQLAFCWVSSDDDLVLIFPTHSQIKCDFTKIDLENLRKSFTWEFENSLAIALIKKRKVSYQFLRIQKTNGEFHMELSPQIHANLWRKLFEDSLLPEQYHLYDRVYIDGTDIVSILKTQVLAVVESHRYRLPLNRISEKMKVHILEKGSFARIIPHGHLHQINGEVLINRTSEVEHPILDKLLYRYKGSAYYMRCHQCGTSMVGFRGETKCALCTNPPAPQPRKNVSIEHGDGYFKVIRNGVDD